MKIVGVIAALVVAGCSQGEDLEKHRKVVLERLLDPASAEFKNEKIRTIWSADGSRKKVYCAELNANNDFGGKTGFKTARVIVEAVNTTPDPDGTVKLVWGPGKSFIDDDMNPDIYLDCYRADTQRKNNDVFIAIPTMGQPWDENLRAEIDRAFPVISMDEAPTR